VAGQDLADRLPALVALAGAIGSHVAFEPVAGDAHGYYELATRRIVIDTSLPANARVKTLVHELSHALLRAEPAEEDLALTRAEEELVVEGASPHGLSRRRWPRSNTAPA
jgi:Zn-dependent peptidase ImmA (M78 family)